MSEAKHDPHTTQPPRKPDPGSRPVRCSIDGVEIDAMLDRIDNVLKGGEKTTEALRLLPGSPEEIEAIIVARLRTLAEELGRLRVIADEAGDPTVASFARETRARVERLIVRKPRRQSSLSGHVEVETDHAGLHEFLLDPDFDRIPG